MSADNLRMSLSCPMPKMDHEIITLGHGSGGLLTNKLLDQLIFEVLGNDILNKRHDGAQLMVEGPIAMTTDSFVVSPIFFPGGNIGELAVNGTVNDLAMSGAKPQYLSLSLIIEEGMRMDELWEIVLSIKKAAEEAGVSIVTGDTKVVEKGKGDQIFINTTGVGKMHHDAKIDTSRVAPGDQIIVSGHVATHGIAIMSVREGLEFESSIKSDTQPLHKPVLTLLSAIKDDVKLLKDPTRGGVASVLNEVARDAKVGIDIKDRVIPIFDEVRGACELLGLDPLYVANEGVFIAVVDPNKSEEALHIIKKEKGFESAAIIGEVTEEHHGQVLLESGIGGKRVVQMLVGQQLPRIC